MESVFLKTASGFVPQDDGTDSVRIGEAIRVTWKRSRNPGNHRRFFAFLEAVFDMQDHFDDKEVLRKWLLMKAGYFDTAIAPNGYTLFLPKSMAWDAMDESDFRKAFDKMLSVAVRELGLNEQAINQVLEFV